MNARGSKWILINECTQQSNIVVQLFVLITLPLQIGDKLHIWDGLALWSRTYDKHPFLTKKTSITREKPIRYELEYRAPLHILTILNQQKTKKEYKKKCVQSSHPSQKNNIKDAGIGRYLMLSYWGTTCTTTKAFRMEKGSHASEIVTIANVLITSTTYSAS